MKWIIAIINWFKKNIDADESVSKTTSLKTMMVQTSVRISEMDRDKENKMEELDLQQASAKISLKQISKNALTVLNRLHKGGYESYLVGGAVRDLLLEQTPKDFDVATNATPDQIKKEFRNCRLIGRRFRLAHVLFGREMIEVATFRGPHQLGEPIDDSQYIIEDESDDLDIDHYDKEIKEKKLKSTNTKLIKPDSIKTLAAAKSESGLLLRDNIYGTIEEDVLRRDFTVNALYFDHYHRKLYDYVGGLQDINRRIIRLIGDPETRYREDPVRMLRAVRFAAKLRMDIATKTAAPIYKLGPLLKGISSPRLFDEVLKLLQSGQGHETYRLLIEYRLFEQLFPYTYQEMDPEMEPNLDYVQRFILDALQSTDKRIAEQSGVNPAFLFAIMLWYPMQTKFQDICITAKLTKQDAFLIAINDTLSAQVKITAIPKRFSFIIRDIWQLQYRLEQRQGRRALKLLTHVRFRAAFDFLAMRAKAEQDPELQEITNWWHDFQFATNEEIQQKMIDKLDGSTKKKGRKKITKHENVHESSFHNLSTDE